MKYICMDCGCKFDDPKHYTEKHGLENGPYEEFDGCPKCGGDYEDIKECDVCGAEIPSSEYYSNTEDKDGHKYHTCDNCWEK